MLSINQYKPYSLLLSLFLISASLFYVNPLSAQDTTATQDASSNPETVGPDQQVPDEIEADAQSIANGRDIFGQHCSVCHMVEKQLIGPALASVHRTRPIPWLVAFIKNSQYVIQETDDEYAKQLFKEYKGQIMPNFEFLTNDDVYDILAYIKSESSSPTYTGGVNGADSDVTQRPQNEYGDSEAGIDPNYNYDDDQGLNDGYSFNQDEAEVESGFDFFAKVSWPLVILLGILLLAVTVSLFYVFSASKKLNTRLRSKEKENA
jgi:mono/diheme cytochrome c family protein